MTKYGISEECAAIMESLGGTLRNATNGIDANSVKLGEKVGALNSNGRLGIFGDEILSLTNGNRSAVQRVGEDIGVISKKAGDTAGKIRELVSAGLVAPAGGAAGSAGSAANISSGGNVSAGSGNQETLHAAGNPFSKTILSGLNPENKENPAIIINERNKYVGTEFESPFKNSNNGENNFIKSENLDAYLKPEAGAAPRSLEKTQLGFRQTEDGSWVYDSPEETNKYMIINQGQAYEEYQGTCGLCSCVNVLRQAGVKVSEKEIIDYAATTEVKQPIIEDGVEVGAEDVFLCSSGDTPGVNGGTNTFKMQKILQHFGVESKREEIIWDDGSDMVNDKTIENLAQYISDGKGVIFGVDAGILWDDPNFAGGGHAVTATSVKTDNDGNILGFYICDTAKNGTKFYSTDTIKNSIIGTYINVTSNAVR